VSTSSEYRLEILELRAYGKAAKSQMTSTTCEKAEYYVVTSTNQLKVAETPWCAYATGDALNPFAFLDCKQATG